MVGLTCANRLMARQRWRSELRSLVETSASVVYPQTGEKIKIKRKIVVKFKLGKTLRDKV